MLFHILTLNIKPIGRVDRWSLSDVIYFCFLHFKHNLLTVSKHHLEKHLIQHVCMCVYLYLGPAALGIINNFNLLNFTPPPPPALSFQKIHLDNHHSPPTQKTCCPVNLCFMEEYQLQVWKLSKHIVDFASTIGCLEITFLKCVSFQVLSAYVLKLFI